MAATASRREQILEAVNARLARIKAGPTFQTDAGRQVFINETPPFGPDDEPAAIAVVIGEDQITKIVGGKVFLILPIEVQAIASSDRTGAWRFTEPVLADIKRAMELDDRTLGGLIDQWLTRNSTRTLERDEGSTTVGVAVRYDLSYSETWGHP